MSNVNPRRVHSDHGLVKDVEVNLLKLCVEAFEEDDVLRHSRLKIKEFVDTDVTKVNLQALPVVYAWVHDVKGDANTTGGLGGRKQRETLVFHCMVRLVTDYVLPKEEEDLVKEAGWSLRDKIRENLNLMGIANHDPAIVDLSFSPDIQMVKGKLAPVSGASIAVVFKAVRKRKLATK